MASHQQRREPLPADYQFPTHGVECDCPPCRTSVTETRYIECGPGDVVHLDITPDGQLTATLWAEPTADTPWAV